MNSKISALNERVTKEIINWLEQAESTSSWSPPWADGIDCWSPHNPVSGKRYTAGNRFNLGMTAWLCGYGQHWATYRQWQSLTRHSPKCVAIGEPDFKQCPKLGCNLVSVRRGEKGTHAVRPVFRIDKETGEMILQTFHAFVVFAAQQVEGYVEPQPTKIVHAEDTAQSLTEADNYAASVGAVVKHSSVRGASYSPSQDEISMPEHDRWKQPDRYWSTLIHELIHWTGHQTRLNRDLSTSMMSIEYAREELVAELGATFHLSHLGRAAIWRDDHAKYLAHWLSMLKSDPKELWNASIAAEQASKLLHSKFEKSMPTESKKEMSV